jgi:hypothetical protein
VHIYACYIPLRERSGYGLDFKKSEIIRYCSLVEVSKLISLKSDSIRSIAWQAHGRDVGGPRKGSSVPTSHANRGSRVARASKMKQLRLRVTRSDWPTLHDDATWCRIVGFADYPQISLGSTRSLPLQQRSALTRRALSRWLPPVAPSRRCGAKVVERGTMAEANDTIARRNEARRRRRIGAAVSQVTSSSGRMNTSEHIISCRPANHRLLRSLSSLSVGSPVQDISIDWSDPLATVISLPFRLRNQTATHTLSPTRWYRENLKVTLRTRRLRAALEGGVPGTGYQRKNLL